MSKFRPRILSRHPSHSVLRRALTLNPFRVIVRLGSITPSTAGRYLEINTVEGVENSMDKLRMKQKFIEAGVKTPKFQHLPDFIADLAATPPKKSIKFPAVVKHRFGSRGAGNYLCSTVDDFNKLQIRSSNVNYIIEEYSKFTREYRIHVSPLISEHLYTNRKLRKNETPENQQWFRNNINSVWILETSNTFKKPANFDEIVAECKMACTALGLDFGAFDVKTSVPDEHDKVKFTIIESNSAPSFGDITAQQYLKYLPEMITNKHDQANPVNTES